MLFLFFKKRTEMLKLSTRTDARPKIKEKLQKWSREELKEIF